MHIGRPEDALEGSTRLTTETPDKPINDNPFESLKIFIKQKKLQFNGILNLGDITNKGFISGFNVGIKMMRELGLICQCPVIFTPGNHDYCYEFEDGAVKLLKRTINYPTDKDDANGNFWGKGYCLYKIEDVLFLICNSGKDVHRKEDRSNIPSFEDEFIEQIKSELERINHRGPKIALTHHHIIQHSDIVGRYNANDTIDHADKFLSTLSDANFNCVLHGHKHISRFMEANNLAIMACGSLSALENLKIADEQNYIHVLTLKTENDDVRGKIESYYYKLTKGWCDIVDHNFSINSRYTFGKAVNLEELAQKVVSHMPLDNPVLMVNNILDKFPEMEFVSNKDYVHLKEVFIRLGYKFFHSPDEGIIIFK